MCQVVAYKRWKTEENYRNVSHDMWSWALTGGGCFWEVSTVKLWLRKLKCFGQVVAYGRWLLTRGGRTWKFNWIVLCCQIFRYTLLYSALEYKFWYNVPVILQFGIPGQRNRVPVLVSHYPPPLASPPPPQPTWKRKINPFLHQLRLSTQARPGG